MNQYLRCPGCNMETLRNQDGTCGFCDPVFRAPPERIERCEHCGTPFSELVVRGIRKRFCSRRCQKYAWEKLYRQRRTARQNEVRAALREQSVKRNSRLERAA